MPEIKLCGKCKRTISDREVAEGLVLEQGGRTYCPDCAPDMRQADPRDEANFILESIFNELRTINSSLSYEKMSMWNVFAAVVQCLVFGVMFLSYLRWQTEGDKLLMLASVLQTMALAFFVVGK